VALSLTLLVGAGLLIQSLRNVGEVDIGVHSAGVLTALVALSPPAPPAGSDTDTQRQHAATYNASRLQPLVAQLRALPGVQAVTISDALPMANANNSASSVLLAGRDLPTEGPQMPIARWRFVDAAHFPTLGIPLLRGRLLDDNETRPGDEPASILVNETFVRRYLGGAEPIGQTVGNVLGDPLKTIVGVVGDSRSFGREADVPAEVYLPLASAYYSQFYIALRVNGDP
jgi:putative ABC transport system permease protein